MLTTEQLGQATVSLLVASPTNDQGPTSPASMFPDVSTSHAISRLDYSHTDFESDVGRQTQTGAVGAMDRSIRLRRELNALKPMDLLRRATRCGADHHEVERAEDSAALVDLIVVKVAALRWELDRLTLKELQQRATQLDVSKAQIETVASKDALIELVARADQSGVCTDRPQYDEHTVSPPATALDQILVGLKRNEKRGPDSTRRHAPVPARSHNVSMSNNFPKSTSDDNNRSPTRKQLSFPLPKQHRSQRLRLSRFRYDRTMNYWSLRRSLQRPSTRRS
jgi:hypothetical protein